jgi:hypothetical protein
MNTSKVMTVQTLRTFWYTVQWVNLRELHFSETWKIVKHIIFTSSFEQSIKHIHNFCRSTGQRGAPWSKIAKSSKFYYLTSFCATNCYCTWIESSLQDLQNCELFCMSPINSAKVIDDWNLRHFWRITLSWFFVITKIICNKLLLGTQVLSKTYLKKVSEWKSDEYIKSYDGSNFTHF